MRQIFVFGSNTEGRHGKGAALDAVQSHGAIYGQAMGLQGNSYAIVTKDLGKPKNEQLRSVPLPNIQQEVSAFIAFAIRNPQLNFKVSAIGCGLAGYTPEEIAPFFAHRQPNVFLPEVFLKVLNRDPLMGLEYSNEQREKM